MIYILLLMYITVDPVHVLPIFLVVKGCTVAHYCLVLLYLKCGGYLSTLQSHVSFFFIMIEISTRLQLQRKNDKTKTRNGGGAERQTPESQNIK